MAIGTLKSKEEFMREKPLGFGYRCVEAFTRASNGLLDLLFGAEPKEDQPRPSSEKLARLYYNMRP